MPFSIMSSCPPIPHIVWAKTWDGHYQEIMHDMVVDSSKDLFIAGEIWDHNYSSNDLFILKINESFSYNITWGTHLREEFCGMVLDTGDNIFVAGTSTNNLPRGKDIFLLKYSNNLTLEWFINWSKTGIDSCTSVAIDSQDNIYITGLMNFPKTDVFLVKFNNSGILKWNRTWNTGFHNTSEEVLSIVIDSQDQIFLGVKTNFTGAEWFLLKYDSYSNLLWDTSYTSQTPLEQLVLDSSNNLYAIGSLNDMFLTKFDNNGNIKWNITCIKEILHGTESIAIDHNDSVYIAGNELINNSTIFHGYNFTDYDTYLMKFNNSGVLQWNETVSYGNNLYLEILAFDPLGNTYLGGSLEMIAPGSLCYAIRIFDHLGNPSGGAGGGCIYGDGICKGIYAESLNNYIAVINSPCDNEENYDINVDKYNQSIFNYCPPRPNLEFYFSLQTGLNTFYLIIGVVFIIYDVKKKRPE